MYTVALIGGGDVHILRSNCKMNSLLQVAKNQKNTILDFLG